MSGVSRAGGISIETLRARLTAATGGEFRRAMSDALGAKGQALTFDGFRGSHAPDGTPWAPVRRKGKPLIDTGALRQSVVMESNEAGFRIEVAAPYAKYQQDGTKPHARAGGILRQNGRGRFVKKGKSAFLTRAKPYTNPGITPRPMVPTADKDLDPVWMPAFKKVAIQVARLRLEP